MKRIILILSLLLSAGVLKAQFYTGMSGLIHVPSADVYTEGDLRVGTYFLNKHFTPSEAFIDGGGRYNTMDFYLSVTPFRWLELGYAFTLMKNRHPGYSKSSYNSKDRYISLKLTPFREGKYLPSISVGANDIFSTFSLRGDGYEDRKSEYFNNYYIAVTKHIDIRRWQLGATLSYRRFKRHGNDRWNGLVGGLTVSPSFARDGRLIAEWDGCRVNVGIDWLLFRRIALQAAMIDCRYFSGGLAYRVNLF